MDDARAVQLLEARGVPLIPREARGRHGADPA
jgi:hypothetical protein